MSCSPPSPIRICTSGNGWWTKVSKSVEIDYIAFEVMAFETNSRGEVEVISDVDAYIEDNERADPDRMEIRCVLAAQAWDAEKDGVVYSDPGFLMGLRKLFEMNHFEHADDIGYTSRAKQGATHVSLQPRSVALMREIWSRRSGPERLEPPARGSNAPRVAYRMSFDEIPEAPIEIYADREIYRRL